MNRENLVGHTPPSVDFPRRLDLEQYLFGDMLIVIELDIGKTNRFQVTWRRGGPICLRCLRSQRNWLLGRRLYERFSVDPLLGRGNATDQLCRRGFRSTALLECVVEVSRRKLDFHFLLVTWIAYSYDVSNGRL